MWEAGANLFWKWRVAGVRTRAVAPAAATYGPSPGLQGVSASSQAVIPGHLSFCLAFSKNAEHQRLTKMHCTPRIRGELCKPPAVAVRPSQCRGCSRRSLLTPAGGRGGSRAWQAGRQGSQRNAQAAWQGAWKSTLVWWGPESPGERLLELAAPPSQTLPLSAHQAENSD